MSETNTTAPEATEPTTGNPETFPLVDGTEATQSVPAEPTTGEPPAESSAAPETNGKPAKDAKKGGLARVKVKVAKPKVAKPSKTDDMADKATASAQAVKDKLQLDRHHKAVALGWNPAPAKSFVLPLDENKKYDPAKTLCFDKRLQMRSLGKSYTDEATVEDYANHMKDNLTRNPERKDAGFPPIRAVRITDEDREANGLFSNIVVFDGFHTGRAAFKAGLKEFPAEVQDGTFKFARLLALSSNSYRGLQRTDDDKKKAFYAVIDDKEMMSDAIELARSGGSGREGGKGGLVRALASVCGISTGSVHNYLAARGQKTSGDKIINAPKPQPATTGPTGEPAAPTTEPAAAAPANGTVNYSSAPQLTPEQLAVAQAVDVVEAVERLQAAMERHIAELMSRDDTRDILTASAKEHGLPFTFTTRSENGNPVTDFSWPVMTDLTMLFDAVKTLISANKSAPATTPAE